MEPLKTGGNLGGNRANHRSDPRNPRVNTAPAPAPTPTPPNHRYAIALFTAAYNFCKVHTTLGCTPAVGLKLATETWTIERLIEEITA